MDGRKFRRFRLRPLSRGGVRVGAGYPITRGRCSWNAPARMPKYGGDFRAGRGRAGHRVDFRAGGAHFPDIVR